MSRGDMAVAKDPAIKLFGRTISLPEPQFSDESESVDNSSSLMTKAEIDDCKNENSGTMDEAASESCKTGKPQISLQNSITKQAAFKSGEDFHGSEEPKPFKRPDKILPCPRCNSLDTKFCYFNNYNVNQPRHFCKSCQRYWTAGGTVRNVPVGAGRRRNKHLESQYRQIIASSDGVATTVSDAPECANHRVVSCDESSSSYTTSSPNEVVLKFGPESPHCDSKPNLLTSEAKAGCSEIDVLNPVPYQKENLPCRSLWAASNLRVETTNTEVSLQQPSCHYTVPPQLMARLISNSNGTMPMAVPGSAGPSVSLQFFPASYWKCVPIFLAGSGNISLAPPMVAGEGGSHLLGKHFRETLPTGEEISEKSLSTPKTLRIHDAHET